VALPSNSAIQAHDLTIVAAEDKVLLENVSFDIPAGSFTTIIGLSGCGKSTLIKALAGIIRPHHGSVRLGGHSVTEIKDQYPLAVGYIPQFGTFHAELTVREILFYAAGLRLPPTVEIKTRNEWLAHIVDVARITSLLDQKYSTLSGGQMRRVALAEELVGDPSFLLLDELTTGLDIFSDGEIMRWLRDLSHNLGKTIILVTHGTEHLALSDATMFLHAGRLVFFGDQKSLFQTQKVNSVEELFGRFSCGSGEIPPVERDAKPSIDPQPLQTERPPSGWHQFPVLLSRQIQLLGRDKWQLIIQAALVVIFPLLVAVFALDGLPEVRALTADPGSNIVRTLESQLSYLKNSVGTASLISGLVMFQVILLTLIGANNGAREIAKERPIFAKELFAGMSPWACISAKFFQLAVFSFVQSFWMAWFVKFACGFPGSLMAQFWILFATTLAMSTTCLAISAASGSPERASLLSIYLVGFQLPLSGSALALPEWLSNLCRPFISAYWGWSGYLRTLDSTRYFRLVGESTKTQIASYDASLMVLGLHVVITLLFATFFLKLLPKSTR
jgi:ABC transport system ATP-binding/permease protein